MTTRRLPRRTATTWVPVIDVATTKDPSKYWQVQRAITVDRFRHDRVGTREQAFALLDYVRQGWLRCTCPGYIFRTRKTSKNPNGGPPCKHLQYVIDHPSILEESYVPQGEHARVGEGPATAGATAPVLPPELRFVIHARHAFRDIFGDMLTAPTLATVVNGRHWTAFCERLGVPRETTPPAEPVASGRVRRIVIDE